MKNYCRCCGNELNYSFADLGMMPLANEYLSPDLLKEGQHSYPLHVMVCDKCFLTQALEFKKPGDIFTDYKYFSSVSKSWLSHCKLYVEMIKDKLNLGENSMVYEIACNDGYLLQYFLPHNIPVCGVDPATNVIKYAAEKGIPTENIFFNEMTAVDLSQKYGNADLIICNNVLAHVPDIMGFIEGLSKLIKDNGTITIEFPHLLELIKHVQFDTIYHEHFSYLSIVALKPMFERKGLRIYHIEKMPQMGGALRLYVTTRNAEIPDMPSVEKILQEEKRFGLDNIALYEDFQQKVFQVKKEALSLLIDLKAKGASIVGFGAAAKGNTFLNYCGIGTEFIDYVVDSSVDKQGYLLPGSVIPVEAPEKIRETKPDYIIFFAWNLKEEFEQLLSYTREWGCKFITLIPEAEIF